MLLLSLLACQAPSAEKITQDGPIDPVFDRFVVGGASLSQGVQSGVPSFHGSSNSPGAVVASLANANFPQPLLQPDLFREISISDIESPPNCNFPSIDSFQASAGVEMLGKLINPDTNAIDFRLGRVDPDLEIQNFAIGGSRLGTLLHGLDHTNSGHQFLGRLVLDPAGSYGSEFEKTPLEYIEDANPSLIMITDLYGNDAINPFANDSDELNLWELTPLEELEPDMISLLERLANTGAEVFLADLPRPSLLPRKSVKDQELLDLGYTIEEINEYSETVDEYAFTVNEMLWSYAEEYSNIHVAPVYDTVSDAENNGLQVGDQLIFPTKFGGLVSLDGLHFSDTGYGFVAQIFIEAMNEELGLEIPLPDLETIHANDRFNPENMKAQGFDASICSEQ